MTEFQHPVTRNSRPTAVRYLAVTWLTLAAALAYLCRNSISVAESTIRSDLDLSLAQSGWFMGSFFWTYAVFQVPTGWFAERAGTRLALTLFAVSWSVAMIGLAVAPALAMLILAQMVMGIAQAGVFPASCNTIGHWMPLSQRSTGCGVLAAGMQVGAIVASALTGTLMMLISWRWVFVWFALPGLAWAAGFYAWFRNRPEQVRSVNSAELRLISGGVETSESAPPDQTSEWRELVAIFRSPAMWLLCGQQICRACGYMFFASWFPTFLQQTRDVSVAGSGLLQGLVFAGTLAGSLVGGMVTDWIWRKTSSLRLSRCGTGAGALTACGLLILAAWFVRSPAGAVGMMALGAFFAALAGPCAFATTIDIGGPRVPQVFGTMNMFGNFAAAACPVLVAMFFQWTDNWNAVLLLFAGVYLIGAVCWLFVDPQSHIDDA
jgi:ACS family glucarate transporter-like MFS transporter/ACS family D-galactonate transporter-like MFS transporter